MTGEVKYKLYTDGACASNPGPAGWGVIATKLEGKKYKQACTFGGNAQKSTNNRMELTAVLEALKYAVEMKLGSLGKSMTVIVVSDSAYVVDSLRQGRVERWARSGWRTKSGSEVKNRDLWEQMLKLLQICEVSLKKLDFMHVKGHSGDTMNELADWVAVRQRLLARRVKPKPDKPSQVAS